MIKTNIKSIFIIIFGIVIGIFLAFNIKFSFSTKSLYNYKIPSKILGVRLSHISNKDIVKNVSIEKMIFNSNLEPNEVIIKVDYASLSHVDYAIYNDINNDKSFVPCSNFSGTIVKIGSNIKEFHLGDDVFGYINTRDHDGSCRQYLKISESNINLIPFSVTKKQAAAIGSAILVADFVYNKAKLTENSTVFLDDCLDENGTILLSYLNYKGIRPYTVDNDEIRSWLTHRAYLIKDEDWKNNKTEQYKKYDLVVDFNNGNKTEDLFLLPKNGGYYISEDIRDKNYINQRRPYINFMSLDELNSKKSVLNEIAELIDDGKVFVKTSKIFHFRQFREAFLRSQKPSIAGKTLIKFI